MSKIEAQSIVSQNRAWFLRSVNFPSYIMRLPVTRLPMTIGRGHECDIRVPDGSISRRHAQIEVQGELVEIIDLDSRNGVVLEGDLVGRASIRSGQVVRLGDWEFVFTFEALAEEATTGRIVGRQPSETLFSVLTPAQRRVAILLLEEHTEREISIALGVSYFTVHNHVKEIYRRCNVQSRQRFLATYRAGAAVSPNTLRSEN